jgi:hypothetical protein
MAVNFSGMCCTMAMPGASAGRLVSTNSNACVPPVELPITTGLFIAKACTELSTGGRLTTALATATSEPPGRTRGLDLAAVLSV